MTTPSERAAEISAPSRGAAPTGSTAVNDIGTAKPGAKDWITVSPRTTACMRIVPDCITVGSTPKTSAIVSRAESVRGESPPVSDTRISPRSCSQADAGSDAPVSSAAASTAIDAKVSRRRTSPSPLE